MQRIKIVGALIFTLSMTLALLFNHTSKENSLHNDFINIMSQQKDFTQEISKNIFYIYKNPSSSTQSLDNSIKKFLSNIKNEELEKSAQIIKLWNNFYLHVQHFRDQINNKSLYSNIILEKSVKDIYNTNLELIVEFDKIIIAKQIDFDKKQNIYKLIQYILFAMLVLLLIYVFTQLKTIMAFMQKFLTASKAIISNSSIKELKPIEINDGINDISQAKDNFNTLVQRINDSIKYSSSSIEHSYKSLEIVEQNIEDLIDLIYTMNENSRDKELRKKEDAVIQSLEELSSMANGLKSLRGDLDNLISYTTQP
ncbi:MAG: hypothetical protein PHQ93_09490 [Sulfurimonas sp.]|uniref:hypothetical protein n=1 Tax=Sulfurimonas sp. TaxID=2022749 RepID=UPI0026312152|nr:hypothetical protein [Sulfurimonas sp.]MDD5401406.1 hypothetical protein [Sulfurimonas sp.]